MIDLTPRAAGLAAGLSIAAVLAAAGCASPTPGFQSSAPSAVAATGGPTEVMMRDCSATAVLPSSPAPMTVRSRKGYPGTVWRSDDFSVECYDFGNRARTTVGGLEQYSGVHRSRHVAASNSQGVQGLRADRADGWRMYTFVSHGNIVAIAGEPAVADAIFRSARKL